MGALLRSQGSLFNDSDRPIGLDEYQTVNTEPIATPRWALMALDLCSSGCSAKSEAFSVRSRRSSAIKCFRGLSRRGHRGAGRRSLLFCECRITSFCVARNRPSIRCRPLRANGAGIRSRTRCAMRDSSYVLPFKAISVFPSISTRCSGLVKIQVRSGIGQCRQHIWHDPISHAGQIDVEHLHYLVWLLDARRMGQVFDTEEVIVSHAC